MISTHLATRISERLSGGTVSTDLWSLTFFSLGLHKFTCSFFLSFLFWFEETTHCTVTTLLPQQTMHCTIGIAMARSASASSALVNSTRSPFSRPGDRCCMHCSMAATGWCLGCARDLSVVVGPPWSHGGLARVRDVVRPRRVARRVLEWIRLAVRGNDDSARKN